MHVLDRFLLIVVHPDGNLERVECFLMTLETMFPMRREGRDFSPMDSFLSTFRNDIHLGDHLGYLELLKDIRLISAYYLL